MATDETKGRPGRRETDFGTWVEGSGPARGETVTIIADEAPARPATDVGLRKPCTIYAPPEYCSDVLRCRVHQGIVPKWLRDRIVAAFEQRAAELAEATEHRDTLRTLLAGIGHPDTDAIRERCAPGTHITIEAAQQVYADAWNLAREVDELRRRAVPEGGESGMEYGHDLAGIGWMFEPRGYRYASSQRKWWTGPPEPIVRDFGQGETLTEEAP